MSVAEKNNVQQLYKLNPRVLTEKKKCIFGTGIHAKQTYVELCARGVKIDYFAERYVCNIDASFMGVPLLSEEQLKNLDVSVIIASTYWEDISKRLIKQGITDLFVDLYRYGEVEIWDNCLYSVGKYHMERNTLYILCPAGIGDTLYVAAFAKAVRDYYKEIDRVCLITKESHICIGDFFEGVDEVIASNQLVEQLDLYSISTKTWYLKNYIYGHFKKNLCQTFDKEYTENKNISILNYYKNFILKIPEESKLDSFHYGLEDLRSIQSLKDKIGNKRFVILMPYANTAKMLSIDFWEKCADYFLKNNYSVFTNVKDETEQEIAGTLPISENIYDMVGICSLAELVISVRSGMCDVLAMSKTSLIILDTDKELYDRWNTKQLNSKAVHIWCCEKNMKDILEEIWKTVYLIKGKTIF